MVEEFALAFKEEMEKRKMTDKQQMKCIAVLYALIGYEIGCQILRELQKWNGLFL